MVRQLNIYGFSKRKDIDGNDIFRHPLFIQGKKELLKLIKRNQPKKGKILGVPDKASIFEEISKIQQQQQNMLETFDKIQEDSMKLDISVNIVINHTRSL